MLPAPVFVSSPMLIPTRANQHRPASHIQTFNRSFIYLTLVWSTANHDAIEVSKRVQFKLRQISSVFIAMKRAIEIRSCVCDHFDFADMKLSSRCIVLPRSFTREMIADYGSGDAFVCDHARFNCVTKIDKSKSHFVTFDTLWFVVEVPAAHHRTSFFLNQYLEACGHSIR